MSWTNLPSTVANPEGFAGIARTSSPHLAIALLLCGFVLLWTVINTIANGGALDHDMTEAYVWGREFQLGYYKHPPFWAWIAGAWFEFLPHRAWAFSLLSSVNAAMGLLGAWLLVGRFADGEKRFAATILLLLTPYFTWFAYRFNANTIFLSLWPWTMLFFVRSLERRRISDALMFGAFAAVDMLSKYYAVLLLASCALAACVHPKRTEYFASVRPWISIATGAVLFTPHLWWLVRNNFLPFNYFVSETGHSWAFSLRQAVNILLESAIWLIPILLLLLLARRGTRLAKSTQRSTSEFRFLAVLCFGPVLLTAIACLAFRLVLTSGTAIATFILAPLLLIELVRANERAVSRLATRMVAAASGLSIAVAPALGYAHAVRPTGMMRSIPGPDQPAIELAQSATALWHARTGAPLRIVAGTFTDGNTNGASGDPYADIIAFYSDDQPSEFIDFDFAHAPWITRERLARDGLLIVCLKSDEACDKAAETIGGSRAFHADVTLRHRFWKWQGAPRAFAITITPPQAG